MELLIEKLFANIPSNVGGVQMQWLKLPAWNVGDHRFEPRSVIQVLKKQKCFFSAHS